ncbi:hypothetical protein SAMN06298226_1592 [Nitrosovibrio sp. Nv4]|nr:hypothetical protein SAMN06298226_1592 [Nitrosovibrio sp. Nv4]
MAMAIPSRRDKAPSPQVINKKIVRGKKAILRDGFFYCFKGFKECNNFGINLILKLAVERRGRFII